MRIAFLWNGVRLRYGKRFKDGLYAALQHLKARGHIIGLFEPDEEFAIVGFKPDAILYWGALIEDLKPKVITYPYKKAICFAGGPIEPGNVEGFDLYFVESEVNEIEFKVLGKSCIRAFGVNEELYKPKKMKKKYDAAFWGTFALWKRPHIFAQAVKDKGIWIGIKQAHEKECYLVCEQYGVETHDELPKEEVVDFINQSYTAVNTANVWGGGQRMTLEAMACNVPPIVMSDSPKNAEYVDESGFGLVVHPDPESIKEAIEKLKGKEGGREYIMSKYTSRHYADSLEKGLTSL